MTGTSLGNGTCRITVAGIRYFPVLRYVAKMPNNVEPQAELVLRVQAKLAAAIGSCDPRMAACFFYGSNDVPPETNVFEILIGKRDGCGRLRLSGKAARQQPSMWNGRGI